MARYGSRGHRVRRDGTVPGLRIRREIPLELGRNATIGGGIRTKGSVYGEPYVTIRGPLHCKGRAVIGARSTIHGTLEAGLDVHLLPGARVLGDVRCGADLHVHPGVHVRGRIHAKGDVVIHGAATTGPIETGGRIDTRNVPPSDRRAAPAAPIPS